MTLIAMEPTSNQPAPEPSDPMPPESADDLVAADTPPAETKLSRNSDERADDSASKTKSKRRRGINPIARAISPGADNVAWRLLERSLSQVLISPGVLTLFAIVLLMAMFVPGFRELSFIVYPLIFIHAVRIVHHGALFGNRLRSSAFHELFLSTPLSSREIASAQHRIVLLGLLLFLIVVELQFFLYTTAEFLIRSRQWIYWSEDRATSYSLGLSLIYAAYWCTLVGGRLRAVPYLVFTSFILFAMFDNREFWKLIEGWGAFMIVSSALVFALILQLHYRRHAVRILCDRYFA